MLYFSELAEMSGRINHMYYADDDPDDHLIFSTIIAETFPSVTLSLFYDCNELMTYLNDENRLLPDIIFLDYNMPGNREFQCLRQVKKTARLLNIPVVIYSTSEYPEGIKQSYEYGAFKYINKPVGFNEVSTTIKQVISEYESRQ